MGAREFGDQLLTRLLTHCVESVPGALGAGVSLAGTDRPHSVSATGLAARLDPAQWDVGEGPLWEALTSRTAVIEPVDPPGHVDPDRWPQLARAVADGGGLERLRGLAVTAGEWTGDTPVLFSMYLDAPPDRTALEQVDRLEGLLANALAVVEYCAGEEVRAEQLLQMVQYRRVIEQAKGLIMGALDTDAETAFSTLSRASQHFNVRLRNLAVALVEHVGRAPAESPDDPTQVIEPSQADRRVASQVWAALVSGRGASAGTGPGAWPVHAPAAPTVDVTQDATVEAPATQS